MRKYYKVAALSAFFCASLCLAQTASKSLESLDSNLNKIPFKTEQARAALVKQDANKDDELTLEEWTK